MLNFKNIYSILILMIIIFWGCKDDQDAIISIKFNELVPRIHENVKYIDREKFDANLISMSADSSIITFKAGTGLIDGIKPGDLFVSEKGRGFLRKVKNVQKQGNSIVIHTEQASLIDAFEQASITYSKKISRNDIQEVLYTKEGVIENFKESQYEFKYEFIDVVIYDLDGNNNTKSDQVVLNGELNLDPWFGLFIEIKGSRLNKMEAKFTFNESVKLEVKATLKDFNFEKEILIKSYSLKPIIVWVGWLPIVLTPKLNIYLGTNGNVTAEVTSKIEHTASFTAGLRYLNNSWMPFREIEQNFNYTPPSLVGELTIEGYIKPYFEILIYNQAGPFTDLKFGSKFNISLLPTPNAKLLGRVQVGVGINLKGISGIIGQEKIEKPDLITLDVILWEKENLTGKLIGIVKNAINMQPLDNVKIIAFRNNIKIDSVYSKNDGTYEIELPAYDNYVITFSRTGFLDEIYYNVKVFLLRTTYLETVLQIDRNYSGFGSISGVIRDAITGLGVGGLSLKVRKGINVTSGSIVRTAVTSSDGSYFISNLEAGNYTIEISGSGYNTNYFTVTCIGGRLNPNQDATVSPIMQPGETRIVLTWGASPDDLDSHFVGPLPSGGKFHMFFRYKGDNSPWPGIVKLDRDDVDGYGPETTTLYVQTTGTYKFFVHDYTNRNSSYSFSLSNSGAQVRVFKANGLVATFNVPPNREGTLWEVFEMSGTNIRPINRFYYVSNPADIGYLGKKKASEIIEK